MEKYLNTNLSQDTRTLHRNNKNRNIKTNDKNKKKIDYM
jgi:hypothetical protein